MKRLIPALLLLSLLLSGCSASLSSNRIDAPDGGDAHELCHLPLSEQVDRLALPQIASGHTPGLAVGIVTADGKRQLFSYGFTDSDRQVPVTPETLFAVGSLTKGFTAETAALLVQQRKLRWSDTLGRLLPEAGSFSADAQHITLEQLASHSAGLPRQVPSLAMLRQLVDYLFTGTSFYDDLDRGEYRHYLNSFSTPAPRRVIYSNLGYALLDEAIAQRTGESVPALATRLILQPLKMDNTSYTPQQLPGYLARARGHAGDQPKFVARGEVVPEWHFQGNMMGAASLWSSASDLLRYLQAHLQGSGDAALDRAFADATRLRLRASSDDSAAAGWLANHIQGQDILYQSGFIGVFASYIGMDKRHGNAIVVLQNSFNWDNNIGHRLLLRMAQAADNPAACR